MSLTRALSNAYSGLVHTSRNADVTANNIANAQTPGYVSRQLVSQERVTGNQGNGVGVSTIERSQDQALSRLRRDADASAGRASVIASATQTLNQEIGEPGSAFGLFASLENLEASLQQFAVTPESAALQTSVITAADQSAKQLNGLSHVALSLRETAELRISNEVSTVNQALGRLNEINGDIAGLNSATGETAAMEDERQRLIDTISAIIPIKDIPRGNQQIHIITEGGTYLLSNKVTELEFNPAGVIPNEARYDDTGNILSGLSIGGLDVTPGYAGSQALSGGTLAGHFVVRDEIATDFTDRIDALSADLIGRFSAAGVDPTLAVGSAGLFTDAGGIGNLTDTRGSAARLQINTRLVPDMGGETFRIRDGIGANAPGEVSNGDIAQNLLNALTDRNTAPANTGLSGLMSVSELAAGLSSTSGEQFIRFEAQSVSASARSTVLRDTELAKTGVDTDAELQKLLVIEQAYAANARVIQTVGEMVDQLLRL